MDGIEMSVLAENSVGTRLFLAIGDKMARRYNKTSGRKYSKFGKKKTNYKKYGKKPRHGTKTIITKFRW